MQLEKCTGYLGAYVIQGTGMTELGKTIMTG